MLETSNTYINIKIYRRQTFYVKEIIAPYYTYNQCKCEILINDAMIIETKFTEVI